MEHEHVLSNLFIYVRLRLEPLGFGRRRRHGCGRSHAGVAAHVLRLLYHEVIVAAAGGGRGRGGRRAGVHPTANFAWEEEGWIEVL